MSEMNTDPEPFDDDFEGVGDESAYSVTLPEYNEGQFESDEDLEDDVNG